MTPRPSTRINATWLALSAVTVVSCLLASLRDASRFGPSTAITTAVVLIAGAKAAGIVWEFMEIRTAPRWLQAVTTAWVAAFVAMVLGLYLA